MPQTLGALYEDILSSAHGSLGLLGYYTLHYSGPQGGKESRPWVEGSSNRTRSTFISVLDRETKWKCVLYMHRQAGERQLQLCQERIRHVWSHLARNLLFVTGCQTVYWCRECTAGPHRQKKHVPLCVLYLMKLNTQNWTDEEFFLIILLLAWSFISSPCMCT